MSQTHPPASEEPRSDRKRAYTFCGSSFGVVRLEDLREIANLKADLVACYRPVNSQEMFALERMAIAQQMILRGARLDAGMFTSAMNDVLDRTNEPIIPMDIDMVGDGDIEITRAQNRNYCIAEGFRRFTKESNLMGLVIRYRVQAERDYRRALEEFQRLERLRPKLPNEPNLLTDPDAADDVAPLSEINRWIPDAPVQNAAPSQPVPPAAPPPETAPQAAFTRTFAAGATPEPAGALNVYRRATLQNDTLQSNILVPIVKTDGSRIRPVQVYSSIRTPELSSARPRARAPRVDNPSVHSTGRSTESKKRTGWLGNPEAAIGATRSVCRKHSSSAVGTSSRSSPSVLRTTPPS